MNMPKNTKNISCKGYSYIVASDVEIVHIDGYMFYKFICERPLSHQRELVYLKPEEIKCIECAQRS